MSLRRVPDRYGASSSFRSCRQAQLALQERAPRRLRRVRRQHQLEVDVLARRAPDLGLGDARGAQVRDGVGDALRRRHLVAPPEPAAEPVHLLRQVREVQLVAERAHEQRQVVRRQRVDRLPGAADGGGGAGPAGGGGVGDGTVDDRR